MLTGLDSVTVSDEDFLDNSVDWRWHSDGGLVSFDFHDDLIGGNCIANLLLESKTEIIGFAVNVNKNKLTSRRPQTRSQRTVEP